jgi:hypothetical protein
MNGDEQGVNLSEFDPSWLSDGGISEGQGDTPDFSDDTQWPAYARSEDQQEQDFTGAVGGSCMSDAGDPPGSGTWFIGSIDGTCQWIDSTTC